MDLKDLYRSLRNQCMRILTMTVSRYTKVIIVSGVVNQDEIEALTQSGAEDFVKKPFEINDLLDRICGLLKV